MVKLKMALSKVLGGDGEAHGWEGGLGHGRLPRGYMRASIRARDGDAGSVRVVFSHGREDPHVMFTPEMGGCDPLPRGDRARIGGKPGSFVRKNSPGWAWLR